MLCLIQKNANESPCRVTHTVRNVVNQHAQTGISPKGNASNWSGLDHHQFIFKQSVSKTFKNRNLMKLIMLTTGFIAATVLFGISCEVKSQPAIWLSVAAMAIAVTTVLILSHQGNQSQNKTAKAV